MIAFWILAVAMVATAIWCITAKKPVYSVVALLGHFAALAAMFLTLNAEFLAAMQVIVYSGAIMILFVFVIALLSSGVAPFSVGPNRLPRIGYPVVALVLISLGFLTYALARVSVTTPASSPSGSPLGQVTALILMVAVIGVILLAGDQPPTAPTSRQAAEVRREMREAILRGGE